MSKDYRARVWCPTCGQDMTLERTVKQGERVWVKCIQCEGQLFVDCLVTESLEYRRITI